MPEDRFNDPFYITVSALEAYCRVAADEPSRLPGFRMVVCHRLRTAIDKLRAMPKPRLP